MQKAFSSFCFISKVQLNRAADVTSQTPMHCAYVDLERPYHAEKSCSKVD